MVAWISDKGNVLMMNILMIKKKGVITMTNIFSTRYAALKERKNNPFLNSMDVIVKVDGGYTIMSPSDYNVWRKQR